MKKKQQKLKRIPKFSTEKEEWEFWQKADTSKYFDFSKAKFVSFPNLKPSTQTISLRLPESMLESLKMLANRNDVPYQSLMKIFLAERINRELQK